MSLKSQPINPVPEETVRIARAVYPKGNVSIHMRDELGTIYEDESFAALFPKDGQPAEAPWRFALVTIIQFAEGLSDRQAADAVRGRIYLKYALGLELSDSGFDASVLSEFRARLIAGQGEEQLLTAMLTLFKQRGWLKARGKQRTDSTHVLAKIRALNRLVCVGETLRHTLKCLAIVAPEWLREHSQPEWADCSGVRLEDSRLPSGEEERQEWIRHVGQDGANVLSALYEPEAPAWLREVPAVEILRRVWTQNYLWSEGKLCWRAADNIPPATLYLSSPYDVDAHYGKKRTTSWVGFKVHLTETREKDQPHLITHVETTTAPISDDVSTPTIHEGLRHKGLLPEQHIVDAGYVDAQLFHQSQQDYDIDLVGPPHPDVKWQARQQTGFAAGQFAIDWQTQQAVCPEGHASMSWTPAIDNRHNEVIKIKFSTKDCQSCPSRPLCTHSTRVPRRTITVRREQAHQALQRARARATTEEVKTLYAQRAGVEGTISQGVRVMGLRRSRYIGQEKTHLQHVATAAALNIVRVVRWQDGVPHAQTRHSPLLQLLRPVA
ncbi:IS1182 family transposase [Ktedonosporobacter rubrisoli]|uniref:IS1182 family transposase n=1 Tax=Ktedonosporobacter rubrisoli TaxID=2509675 RepID=A0A4P6JPH9_KTERU|nr:IS1182 family transposase [Ktedonosporobacter rubrisoli]QBD77289.1 IS1182 family transposase [Ktedonosporobacter rubrisoli]